MLSIFGILFLVSAVYVFFWTLRKGKFRRYLCSAKSRSSGTRSSFLRITTKLLIYGLFQKGRVLAQDGVAKC